MRKLLIIAILVLCAQAFADKKADRSFDEIKKAKEALVKIDKSIDITRQKMKEVKDVTFLPDLYFVLAELYIDKGRYLNTRIREENIDTPIAEIDFFEAKKAKKEAIEIYQRFIETFPKNEAVDRALFYIAHEYRELGTFDDMVKTYIKLTHDFPKSLFWEESELILGDFFLEDKKDPNMALEAYQRIMERPTNAFIPIARYKTGWCYINKDDFHHALLAFEGVLTVDANANMDKLPELYKKSDIKRDAILALVWPYSEEKTLDPFRADTLTYFEKLSPNKTTFLRVLDKLTKRLSIKHKYDMEIPVYFKLIELTNDLERRVEIIDDFYIAFRQSKKNWPIEILSEPLTSTIMRVRFSPDFSAKEKQKDEKNFELYLRDVSTRLQKKAKASHVEADYLNAIEAYEDYLVAFPKTKYSPSILLDLAESNYTAKKYVMAGLKYEEVLRATPKIPKKNLLDSAIQSFAIALKTPEKISKLEITQAREGFRAMGGQFVKLFPADPASAMVRFNIARTFYDERDFDHAVQYFTEFIKTSPGHKDITTAGNLILDAYNQREDYDGLITAGKSLISNKNVTDVPFKKDVSEVVRQAEYRKVQNVAGDPKNREYAARLLGFASKYQGTSLGDQALYEAFSSMKAKKDPAAYGPGEQLLEKHADSKYAKEVVSAMGSMALNTADYRRAAQYFEIFIHKYPKDESSPSLLKNAAILREAMGDFKEAAQNYRELGTGFKEDVARQFALSQNWGELAQTLTARPVNTLRGKYWTALALYRQGQFDQARPFLLETSQYHASTFEEKKMAAHSLYLLSTQALKDYQSIQLGNGGNEGDLVKKKSAKLAALEKQFSTVINFGNGRWTIAALYQMGRANNEFAQFIGQASIPVGLAPEQQAQYKQLIAQQSSTFQGKAKTYFATCVQNAEKFEVFTGFVGGCQTQGVQNVDEASEEKTIGKAADVTPAEATNIRKQLFDKPKDTNLLFALAITYVNAQEYPTARAILNHILELKPNDAFTESQLGTVFLLSNDVESAQTSYQTALKHKPKEVNALYAMAGLYKHFGFTNKFKVALAKAHAAGRPNGLSHPWFEGL